LADVTSVEALHYVVFISAFSK